LARDLRLPVWKDAFGVQGRKLFLDAILELKVQRYLAAAALISHNCNCFARVVIAVMKEKDDFSPDLFLETPRRDDLSKQKPLGKKSARLLAKTNNRVIHRSE
jgi:hypothetical protein